MAFQEHQDAMRDTLIQASAARKSTNRILAFLSGKGKDKDLRSKTPSLFSVPATPAAGSLPVPQALHLPLTRVSGDRGPAPSHGKLSAPVPRGPLAAQPDNYGQDGPGKCLAYTREEIKGFQRHQKESPYEYILRVEMPDSMRGRFVGYKGEPASIVPLIDFVNARAPPIDPGEAAATVVQVTSLQQIHEICSDISTDNPAEDIQYLADTCRGCVVAMDEIPEAYLLVMPMEKILAGYGGRTTHLTITDYIGGVVPFREARTAHSIERTGQIIVGDLPPGFRKKLKGKADTDTISHLDYMTLVSGPTGGSELEEYGRKTAPVAQPRHPMMCPQAQISRFLHSEEALSGRKQRETARVMATHDMEEGRRGLKISMIFKGPPSKTLIRTWETGLLAAAKAHGRMRLSISMRDSGVSVTTYSLDEDFEDCSPGTILSSGSLMQMMKQVVNPSPVEIKEMIQRYEPSVQLSEGGARYMAFTLSIHQDGTTASEFMLQMKQIAVTFVTL